MIRPDNATTRLQVRSGAQSKQQGRWLLALAMMFGLLLSSFPVNGSFASAQSANTDLTSAVQAVTAPATGAAADSIIVEVVEAIDEWAYGTATAPAGADDTPSVKFFLANRNANGAWTVALRYAEGFSDLLNSAPPSFPSGPVRSYLDGSIQLAGTDYAQLSFPFPAGETWHFWGPHQDDNWNALDFTAGDTEINDQVGTVVAMRGGSVYKPCSGMVMIDHGDGWATGYYHVDPATVSNGQSVARGEAIGFTSTNFECGGFAVSNHVHVWAEYLGARVSIAGQDIGGWTVENGPDIYLGCLVKGADRRCRLPDGNWNNYVTNTSDIGSGGTATVDISGGAGPVGTNFDYAIAAFPANTSVSITWRRPGGSTVALGTVTTNATGTFSGQLTVPATTMGEQNRITFASATVTQTVLFNVRARATVSPSLVEPGDPFTVTVSGFPKQTLLYLTAWVGASTQSVGTITTNNTGGGTITVPFPNGLPNGLAMIDAFFTDEAWAQADFEVTGSTVQGPPSASVTPSRSTVNNWLTLSVNNFPANSPVTVKWIRPSGSSFDVATLNTDALGNATEQIRVPATPGGMNYLWFVAGSTSMTVDFVVAPRIKVIPAVVGRGDTVDVSLRGYGRREMVRIRWKQGSSWVELGQVQTSNTGSANVSLVVPNWAPDGATSVRGDGTTFRAQTNAVTVAGGIALAEEATATPSETPTPVIETPTPAVTPDVTPADPATTPTPEAENPTATPVPTEEPAPTEAPTEPAPAEPTPEPSPTEVPVDSPPAD